MPPTAFKRNHKDLKDLKVLFLEDQGGPALASTWGSALRCTVSVHVSRENAPARMPVNARLPCALSRGTWIETVAGGPHVEARAGPARLLLHL